jgi:hypothetical protein
VHEFELRNGKMLRVFTSPYTPEFNGFAFAYTYDEDRFNPDNDSMPENIDIIMTHGPLSRTIRPTSSMQIGKAELVDAVNWKGPSGG